LAISLDFAFDHIVFVSASVVRSVRRLRVFRREQPRKNPASIQPNSFEVFDTSAYHAIPCS
jgi:hypothetical protein